MNFVNFFLNLSPLAWVYLAGAVLCALLAPFQYLRGFKERGIVNRYHYAVDLYHSGRPETADATLREYVKTRPKSPYAYLLLGKIAMDRGDLANAETYYSHARGSPQRPGLEAMKAEDPQGLADVYTGLGVLYARRGLLAGAQGEADLTTAENYFAAVAGDPALPRVDAEINQAILAMIRGKNPDQAALTMEALAAGNPQIARDGLEPLYNAVALARALRREIPQAREELEKVARLDPKNRLLETNKGVLAILDLKPPAASALTADQRDALAGQGESLIQRGIAGTLDPGIHNLLGTTWFNLAEELRTDPAAAAQSRARDYYRRARERFGKAAALSRGRPLSLYNETVAMIRWMEADPSQGGGLAGAIQANLQRLLESGEMTQGERLRATTVLADIQIQQGDVKSAIQAFAPFARSADPAVQRTLGILHHLAGDPMKALELYKTSLAAQPAQEDLQAIVEKSKTRPEVGRLLPAPGELVSPFSPVSGMVRNLGCPLPLKPESVDFRIDGKPVKDFVLGRSEAIYVPKFPFSDGVHKVTLKVTDALGNSSAEAVTHFRIDTTGPKVTARTPGPDEVLTDADRRFRVRIEIADVAANADPTSVAGIDVKSIGIAWSAKETKVSPKIARRAVVQGGLVMIDLYGDPEPPAAPKGKKPSGPPPKPQPKFPKETKTLEIVNGAALFECTDRDLLEWKQFPPEDGEIEFEVYAKDLAGNEMPAEKWKFLLRPEKKIKTNMPILPPPAPTPAPAPGGPPAP